MERNTWVWVALPLALLVAMAGGAGAVPTLSVEPAEGPIWTPIVATGTGYTPGQSVDIVWSTMVGNRVSGSGFAEVRVPLGTAVADPSGNLRFGFEAPADLGGPPHPVLAMDGETVLAESEFMVTRTAEVTPASGPPGTMIELHMTGGGWTQYDNIVAVTYDNAYIGYMCSFNTQGNMTTWFPATGGPGLHTIDVWPALYYGPSDGPAPWKLPHLSEGDVPWQPPIFHFEFLVTEEAGAVGQDVGSAPPAAPGGDGAVPLYMAAGLLLLAAVAMEVPIRHRKRMVRPAAAAAALVMVGALGALAVPTAAAEGAGGDEPDLELMAAGTGPAVLLERGVAVPGQPLAVSGVRLPAGRELTLAWNTVDVQNQVNGEKFLGWKVTPEQWTLGTVTTDSNGAFSFTLETPYDYQGVHQVSVLDGSTELASSGLIIEPRFEIVGPDYVLAGEQVTVKGYGLGYEKYSASWNVAYDNRLTGWVSGIESHGNVTFSLYAVGAPGQHFIDIGEGAVGFPYLNLHESPFPNRPPGHVSFFIVEESGTLPPEAPAGAGDVGLLAPVALAGAAGALLGAQAVRMWSGPAAGDATRGRKPSP